MKKLLLASAVAALSVTAAQAAPTIYGKAFLTLDAESKDVDRTNLATNKKTSNKTTNRTQLNSNSSRIGFKGSEPLTANTDLVYQLEYGVDVDSGSVAVDDTGRLMDKQRKSQQFYARDTYLGLANAQYGTVVAGRLTAIDDEVDYANVTQGGVLGGNGVLAAGGERANNAFAYFSPDYNGMQVMAMYVMDENKNTDTFNRDAFGIGTKYEQGPMRVGASYIGLGSNVKRFRVSGAYDISPIFTVGGLYQLSDVDSNDNENALTVSGEMKTATPWVAYAQGDMVTNAGGNKDDKQFRLAVGGKYAFNKATIGHVYGAYLNSEESESKSGTAYSKDTSAFGVGGGLEYKF